MIDFQLARHFILLLLSTGIPTIACADSFDRSDSAILRHLRTDVNSTATVICPAGCASLADAVHGCENLFSLSSPVCKAAIHEGSKRWHNSVRDCSNYNFLVLTVYSESNIFIRAQELFLTLLAVLFPSSFGPFLRLAPAFFARARPMQSRHCQTHSRAHPPRRLHSIL
jgi:hypothetical protein